MGKYLRLLNIVSTVRRTVLYFVLVLYIITESRTVQYPSTKSTVRVELLRRIMTKPHIRFKMLRSY